MKAFLQKNITHPPDFGNNYFRAHFQEVKKDPSISELLPAEGK
jgi:hypothetical protein